MLISLIKLDELRITLHNIIVKPCMCSTKPLFTVEETLGTATEEESLVHEGQPIVMCNITPICKIKEYIHRCLYLNNFLVTEVEQEFAKCIF